MTYIILLKALHQSLRRNLSFITMLCLLCQLPTLTYAANPAISDPDIDRLLLLDIAELNVTSLSRTMEKVTLSNNTFHIPANVRFDTRLGWKPTTGTELSVIGRNLLNSPHPEFDSTPTAQIGPSIIGTAAWRF